MLLVVLLGACKENRKAEETPAPLYPKPQTVELNTEFGYTINPITGDTIQPLINLFGDTLFSGVPIPVEGKVIHPDSVAEPKMVVYEPPVSTYNSCHPNRYKVPNDLTVIPVNKDSLTTIFLENISAGDTSHYTLNGLGDTIPSGIPVPTRGKTVLTIQPQPTIALSPRFKDAAINNIQYMDVDQGMSYSYVISLLADQNGNIWFGTNGDGVNMYNGESFIHFTEKEGLSGNTVWSILEDNYGNIWFGTYGGGVSMYNGEYFTHFTEREGLSNNIVLSILEDSKGNIWFGTYGGGVSMYNGQSLIHFTEKEGLSNNFVRSILEDKNGNIWFGTEEGVNMYNGEFFTHFTEKEGLSNNSVRSMLEDKNGNIWFGTREGLNMYNNQSITVFTEKEGLSDNTIQSILEDTWGNIWFGTLGGGVIMYNGEIFTHYTEKEGLSNNYITSILEDQSGNLWFGTYGGGVCIYNRESFTHFIEKEGLSDYRVISILEDNKGNLWFGTREGGVSMYNGEYFTQFTEKDGLSNNTVRSIIEDHSGNLWFGTNGGVSMYNGEYFTHFTEKEGLSNNIVWSIIEDQRGNLWFGTNGGVSMYNGEHFTHFTEKEGLITNIVYSILEDKNGNLWFCTEGGGVIKYTGEVFVYFTEKEGLSSNFVSSMLEDKNGNLWFGTYGSGVSIFDGKTFVHYTEKEGLSNNNVSSLREDNNGSVWVSTESGLTQFVYGEDEVSNTKFEEDNKKVTLYRYLKNDGLKGMDFYSNSACLDSKNIIWWGSGKCLTMLDLNECKRGQNPPTLFLNQLDIDEQFIDFRNITETLGNEISFNGVQKFKNYPLNLELPHDINHLTFHFAAIDWYAPHKIQYSYIMIGLDNSWSKPNHEAKADYRNLPYGTYTFRVRAIGESGEWSEPYEYTFTIHPPWWHTWWARTLYVILSSVLIFSFVHWRTTQLKQRQRELKTKVEVATEEIRAQKDESEKQRREAEKQRDEVKYQKEVIEEAHKEIRDSINYAKRIQSAILPPQKLVKKYLPKSFILHKPKDVVAGDFYWIDYKDGKTLFAAADCTGHGVPGALVSVVCNNSLNKTVREHGITDPGKILSKTRELIVQEFEKSEDEVKDGMDISLCVLEGTTLKWAGANNPIWIIRNGEILEKKPDKQTIGKVENPKPYTTHQFSLTRGDSIYIFTDGFQDQFGGTNGKKFKSANFKQLLLKIQGESMEKQREILDTAFEEWRDNLEQTDDVCVFGVKI